MPRSIILRYQWQAFAPCVGDDTCLWCGRKLRRKRYSGADELARGDYGDGAFCGLRCGYQFGVSLAALGYRCVGRKLEGGEG